jgi:hypothetical protein
VGEEIGYIMENAPLTLEQTRQLQRGLMEKLLDRAASDPQFKQQVLDDPEAAMREFPEAQQIMQMQGAKQQAAQSQEGEVTGQAMPGSDPSTWGPPPTGYYPIYNCVWYSMYYQQEWIPYWS